MSVTDAAQSITDRPGPRSELRLPSLEVHNFRAFEHLKIEHLGRVNLVTGRNNVGKTSVLEAIHLFARSGGALPVWELLTSRDEFAEVYNAGTPREGWASSTDKDPNLYPLTVKHLFYGRKDLDDFPGPILIGPVDNREATLHMLARWYRVYLEDSKDGLKTRTFTLIPPTELESSPEREAYLSVQMGKKPEVWYSIAQLSDRSSYLLRIASLAQDKQSLFIKPMGVDNTRLSRLWNNILLSPLEDEVLAALQIIAPDIERVSVRVDQATPTGPVPIVKFKSSGQPFPLRTMGDGMVRLFGIALALVNARDGFLLIDEVENGLHYSIQPDVWRLIFRVASQLNVQVLATTHSWDCIEAFQKAAADDECEGGVLVRLQEKQGKIKATCFDEADLAIITQNDLEAR
jgi:hypothetical protein